MQIKVVIMDIQIKKIPEPPNHTLVIYSHLKNYHNLVKMALFAQESLLNQKSQEKYEYLFEEPRSSAFRTCITMLYTY